MSLHHQKQGRCSYYKEQGPSSSQGRLTSRVCTWLQECKMGRRLARGLLKPNNLKKLKMNERSGNKQKSY